MSGDIMSGDEMSWGYNVQRT
ncbi:hypothetical protein BV898_13841, partial [Hypsibius exemplaris]